MADVPAMCAGCGLPLALDALRIAAITPEGRVDLVHEGDDGRCGPVIVAALAAVAPDDGHRNPNPVARRLEALIRAHTEALELLPAGDAPVDLPAKVAAYEWRWIAWAVARAGDNIERAATLLGISWRTVYRRLVASGTWEPRYWTAATCDAAILECVAAAGCVSSLDIIARLPAPSHWTPVYRRTRILGRLTALAQQGALTATPGASRHDPYRYAIPQRGAA